ncbi:MAG: drug/metabolite exporter YedA [Acidobacteriota bacterium]|nr:drug/metabolite exporter YedA [Acidobacteriota bacterium]
MNASGTSSLPARWLVVTAFAAVYLIWGSTYLAIRFAIETLPPFGMAAVRFLVAGSVLYAWARWRGAPRPHGAEWRAAAIVGGLLLLGGNGLVVWAEQTVPSGIAALIISTVPLFMVALDWLRGNRPPRVVTLGLVIGFVGVAVLIGPSDLKAGLDDAVPFDLAGVVGLLLASLFWSIGSLYSKRAPAPRSPLLGIGMQMIMGGLWLTLVAVLRGETVDLAAVSLRSSAALGYLIVFGALIGFSSYVWLLKVVPTAQAATYAYVNPVVAVVLGWWLANEELTPRTILAALIIVVGVFLITTARPKRPEELPRVADQQPPPLVPEDCVCEASGA